MQVLNLNSPSHSTQVTETKKQKGKLKIPVHFLVFQDANLCTLGVLPAVPSDHTHFIWLKYGSVTSAWTFPAESYCLLRRTLSSWITRKSLPAVTLETVLRPAVLCPAAPSPGCRISSLLSSNPSPQQEHYKNIAAEKHKLVWQACQPF